MEGRINIITPGPTPNNFLTVPNKLLQRFWPQEGAATHHCLGDAVLLSDITEVSGATGLEPDVVPKLSIVLRRENNIHATFLRNNPARDGFKKVF